MVGELVGPGFGLNSMLREVPHHEQRAGVGYSDCSQASLDWANLQTQDRDLSLALGDL